MLIFIIALAALLSIVLAIRHVQLHTGFMAVVMTLGILNFGVLELPKYHSIFNGLIYYVTFLLWVTFWFHILVCIWKRTFIQKHTAASTNRFTIGTWVAGNSIMIVLTHHMFDSHHGWISFMAALNVGLWIAFIVMSIVTLGKGITEWRATSLHGNLFLTTVSSQSVAIMLLTIFPQTPILLIVTIIMMGLIFYAISFLFITSHFSFSNWNATNCIFHGALSISGVTLMLSGLWPMENLVMLWLVTLIVFIIIEAAEITVLVKQLTKENPFQVIFSSNISHWSRLFTFCMFFTFTHLLSFSSPLMRDASDNLLSALGAVIFALLILELISIVFSYAQKRA